MQGTAKPSASLGSSADGQATDAVFRRLLALTWTYRAGCILALILSALQIALTVWGLRLLGVGIDYLRLLAGDDSVQLIWPMGVQPPANWSPLATIATISGGIFLTALAAALFKFMTTTYMAALMQGRLVVDLRSRVYDKLQRLSFRFYDANETGSIINRVTADVQGMREFVEVVVMQSIVVCVSLVIYLICMLQLHVPLTLACLVTVPVMWWLAVRFSALVRPAYRLSRELMDKLIRFLVESVQGVHVVKGFALEDSRVTGFGEQNQTVQEQRFGIYHGLSRFVSSVHFLVECNMVVLLAFGGYLVINGSLGLGSGLVVFAGLLQQFAAQVQSVANITNSIQNSMTGAARVFEILDAPVEVADDANAQPAGIVRGELRFEGLGFRYRDTDQVLQDIDLQVPAGACVALLGATGAGKSSLLSLIARFYDPTAGRILLDGVDLKELRLDDLRQNVGVVFQESFLFSRSIAENIAFGRPQASREEVETAARVAAAHDFIAAMPQGYDTIVGERGANLSGGQRQRLAIARAVISNPAILLLDDATAAIDPETEGEIMAAMESAMRGRTTFIVAHRLSTLRRADLVVVLDHGRIVQQGTHKELMAADGRYKEAAELQSAHAESKRLLLQGRRAS